MRDPDQLVKEYFAHYLNEDMARYGPIGEKPMPPLTADNIIDVDVNISDGYGSDSGTWWEGDHDIVVKYWRPTRAGQRGRPREFTLDLRDLPFVLAGIAKFAAETNS